MLYQKLIGQLKKYKPTAVAELRASERKWIAFRDAECSFQDTALSSAGVAPVSCLEELTLQRLATLKKVSETVAVELEP